MVLLIIPLLNCKSDLRHKRSQSIVHMSGARRLGHSLDHRINTNTWIDIKVVGVVDNDEAALSQWDLAGVPTLGSTQKLEKILEEHGIVSAYIALPLNASAEMERIYARLVEKHVNIYWTPDVFGLNPLNLSLR